MSSTPEQLLQLAKDRGFEIIMHSSDRTWYNMMSDKSPIALELYPKKNEFRMVYIYDDITIASGKCGSFDNDKHFSRIANKVHKIAVKLQAPDRKKK